MVRSFDVRILGGICGGLGQYTPLNAWLWRLLWVVSIPLTNGASAWLYLLLWWALPQPFPNEGKPNGWLVTIALTVVVIGGWLGQDGLRGPNGESLYWPAMFLLAAVVFFWRQFGRNRRTNPLLGLVWVATASVLLAVNLGYLPDGLSDLIGRSWPALLIFFGLSVFLRDRVQFGGVLALIFSGIIVGGIVTTAFSARSSQLREEQQLTISESISAEVQLLQVNIEALTTDVEVLTAETPSRNISAIFTGSDESEIIEIYEESGDGLATFTLRETRPNPLPRLEAIGRGRMTIALPSGLATSIAFKNQDGASTFNLGQLSLERLDIDVFKGDVVITLPAYNPLSPTVQQNPGDLIVRDGNITIRVPQDVGGRFVLNRDRSRRPEHDTTRYLLIDDGAGGTLQHINFDSFDIKLNYIVTAVNGMIRLEVYD